MPNIPTAKIEPQFLEGMPMQHVKSGMSQSTKVRYSYIKVVVEGPYKKRSLKSRVYIFIHTKVYIYIYILHALKNLGSQVKHNNSTTNMFKPLFVLAFRTFTTKRTHEGPVGLGAKMFAQIAC